MRTGVPFEDRAVAAAFDAFPQDQRVQLLDLRDLIFQVSADHPETGTVLETLKWGQPAYLTPETKSGSTLRLGLSKAGQVALFAHCQTTIIADFQTLFPDDFAYQGARAVFVSPEALPKQKLRLLIASALTYHLTK